MHGVSRHCFSPTAKVISSQFPLGSPQFRRKQLIGNLSVKVSMSCKQVVQSISKESVVNELVPWFRL
jgi:hypothetical protein